MPDEDGKVWLLEVNGSPAAAERMTPSLAADVVELAIDKIYPPGGAAGAVETTAGGGDDGAAAGDGAEEVTTAAVVSSGKHPRWADISNLAAGEGGGIETGPPTPPKVV